MLVKWFKRGSYAWLTLKPGSRPRRISRFVILKIRDWAYARPASKKVFIFFIRLFPVFEVWLRRLHNANPVGKMPTSPSSIKLEKSEGSSSVNIKPNLNPRAREFHMQLKHKINTRQKSYK